MNELQEFIGGEYNPTEDIGMGTLDHSLDTRSEELMYLEETYLKCNVFPRIYEACSKID